MSFSSVPRRTILTTAVALCSGCTALTGSDDNYKFRAEDKTIDRIDARCRGTDNAATVDFRSNAVIVVSGRIRTNDPCEPLFVSVFSPPVGSDEESAILRVSTDPSDTCARSCESTIEYRARLRLNQQPSPVDVFHAAHDREEVKATTAWA
ncbi:hypothetical protein [Halostella sp. PRR32]|uniref:hypothetical protein n=1 Tax=Halostella sp. PRR32 TaxID=3098147 RepID=UPI002B1D08ED|nr:hypothetical protein [Halostella sp. PRR32]